MGLGMYKELVEYVVKRLVDAPEKVAVAGREESGKLLLEIRVDAKDRGRIIGKEGQTIRALRMLVGAVITQGQEVQVVLAE